MNAPSSPKDFTWELLPSPDNNRVVPGNEPGSADQDAIVPVQPITFLDRGSISAYPGGMTQAQMPRVASVETDENSRAIQYVYTYRNGVTIGRSVLGTFLSLDSNLANAVQEFDIYKYGKKLKNYYDGNSNLPWKLAYPSRMLSKVAGAFFRASDTLILPPMSYDKAYNINKWDVVTGAVKATDKPRDVMQHVSPLARMLLTLNVHIGVVDGGLKQIETRAIAMGLRSDGAASEGDFATRRELILQRQSLIDQALSHRTQIGSVASAEKERVDHNILVASVVPEGLPNIPEVRESTEAIQRVFSDLFTASKNDGPISRRLLNEAASSMANSIQHIKDPSEIMLMYANFVGAWGQRGLKLPDVDTLRGDIAQHRDLR